MSSSGVGRPGVVPPVDTNGAFVGDPAILAVGRKGGPLDGVSLAVKDLFAVAGVVTGAGNPMYAVGRAPAPRHAPSVQGLVDAGATVIGMTITDELAFSLSGTNIHFGTPRNPAAPGHVPGGSSAGSVVAVAAGLADLGLGTDTAGSIRVPASHCGVFGWRSSHGSVPLDEVVPLATSFDTVGVFARDLGLLGTAAAVLLGVGVGEGDEVIGGVDETGAGGRSAGPSGTDPAAAPVIRWMAEAMEAVDPAVGEALRAALVVPADLDIDEVRTGIDLEEALAAQRTRQMYEAWQAHGAWIREAQPTLGPGISARFEAASRVTAEEVAAGDPVRDLVRSRIADLFESLPPGAVVALPAAAGGAAPLDGRSDRAAHDARRTATLRLTCVAGLVGAPVVVAPLAEIDGLPLGVAFMGRPGSDLELIRSVAAIVERLGGTAAIRLTAGGSDGTA